MGYDFDPFSLDGVELAAAMKDPDPPRKGGRTFKRRKKNKPKPAAPAETPRPVQWHPMMKPFAILTDGNLTTDPAVIEAARAANMIAAESRSLPSLLTGGPMYQAAEIDGRLAIVPRGTVPGARDFPPFPGCHGIYESGPLYRF